MEMSVIVLAAPKFYQLKGMIYSILKTTSYSLKYSCILLRYFRSIEEHLKLLSESRKSTSFWIQPVRELLGSSGRIGVAVEKCWVVELWLPNDFTFCWCRWHRVWGCVKLPDHEKPHKLRVSVKAQQQCMMSYTNCIDVWKLGRSAWDQELGNIECTFHIV